MEHRFPPSEPYDAGWLDVGDGHQLYWEACGNPAGVPAVLLHGGPGSGCSPGQRRLFDPSIHRAILFDQRGCGRSAPLVDWATDLSTNCTTRLIADLEILRAHVGVERWNVVGLSWGTTLGLAYAQSHPERVSGMVLGLVGTTSRREVEWLTRDVGRLFPHAWKRFTEAIPRRYRRLSTVDAYAEMLVDDDPCVRECAAREWCAWEDAHVSLTPGHQPNPRFDDPDFAFRFARLVTHYWRHFAFLEEDQLVRNASRLNGIPGIMIHGRYDVSSPLETAWRLSREWTMSELRVLEDAGHGGGSFLSALLSSIDQLAAGA